MIKRGHNINRFMTLQINHLQNLSFKSLVQIGVFTNTIYIKIEVEIKKTLKGEIQIFMEINH